MQTEQELTTREAAQKLRIGLDSVYALLWAGKLAARRVEGRWRIPASAITERLKRKEQRHGTASR
jgi:excisionase family DNA binding protein